MSSYILKKMGSFSFKCFCTPVKNMRDKKKEQHEEKREEKMEEKT